MSDYKEWDAYEEYLPSNIEGMFNYIETFYRKPN